MPSYVTMVHMVVLAFFRWWYGAGWWRCIQAVGRHVVSAFDYFSIDLLVRTWFAPFRQISAGAVRGPIGVQIRAFFDRLISRTIGAIVRSFMIIFGVVALIVTALIGVVVVVGWALVPALPIIGVVLTMKGWLPW